MATTKYLDNNGLLYYHQKVDAKYVAKESGKGLSTNDYTDAEKEKVASAIQSVKVNGTALVPDTNKAVDVTVPTKTSDLTNDSNFQTDTQVSTAISNAIAGVTQFDYTVVQELPASGVKGTIYLVANSGETQNTYDEYLWINNAWEKLGTTSIDLSGYYTSAQTDTLLAAKMNTADLVAITNSEIDTIVAG